MLEVRGISKKFGQTEALRPIDLTIGDGCILGLVGSNGAGKSTLLRLLCGIYKPDAGSILFDGRPVYDDPQVKSQLVFVPDELYFLPNANIVRMARFYGSAYRAFDMKRFDMLCEELQIDKKKPLREFSKGMKRQAAIILALSCGARYLFLDEVFDGLDLVKRRKVRALLNQVVEEQQGMVVLTSHSLRELEGVCDRLALLHEGALILDGDTEGLESTRFKVQVAMPCECEKEDFSELHILSYEQNGSVVQMIVEGDRGEITYTLREKEPVLLDILPLNLEEIFLYQLESLGYDSKLLFHEEETDTEENNV